MSVTRYYCTYFDQRYLPRALALYQSLKEHGGDFCLWALCLDDLSYQRLTALNLQEMRPISHEEFTRGDEQLLAARSNRSLVEYYFTCSPSLPLFVLNSAPAIDMITYLDADLYFFASPEHLFDEIGSASIAIIPHRFPDAMRHLEENGIYNVSWITFRRDAEGLACLQRWRSQCLEWCYDRVEGTRYADQGYLNDWPASYRNLTIIQQKGANLAPWNTAGCRLSMRNQRIWVDDDPLVFFHFQGLQCVRPGMYKLNFERYKAKPSRFVRAKMYAPYIRAIERISSEEMVAVAKGNIRIPAGEVETWHGIPIPLWLKYAPDRARRIMSGDYMFSWDYRA